jgi:hypothetical protein
MIYIKHLSWSWLAGELSININITPILKVKLEIYGEKTHRQPSL